MLNKQKKRTNIFFCNENGDLINMKVPGLEISKSGPGCYDIEVIFTIEKLNILFGAEILNE